MKLCMVSGADFDGNFVSGHMDCMFDWVSVFNGVHRSIASIKEDIHQLDEYDVVMLVDADRFLDDANNIALECSCKTIFVPEGTIYRHLRTPFGNYEKFHRLLQNVDLIGAVEEDRIPWYESIWDTKVFFMHTPASDRLLSGNIKEKVKVKLERILICCNLGFGEPYTQTNLPTSLGIVKKTGKEALLCEIPPDHAKFMVKEFGIEKIRYMGRSPYLFYMQEVIGPSKLLLNPSELIGTSRNAIVGAAVGTPVIGNMHSHTQQRLFPDLCSYIYDTNKMVDLVNRLYEDPIFYKDVCDRAFEEVQYYSKANAKKRFEEAVAGVMG